MQNWWDGVAPGSEIRNMDSGSTREGPEPGFRDGSGI